MSFIFLHSMYVIFLHCACVLSLHYNKCLSIMLDRQKHWNFFQIIFIERKAVCRNLSFISGLHTEQMKEVFVANRKVSQIEVYQNIYFPK